MQIFFLNIVKSFIIPPHDCRGIFTDSCILKKIQRLLSENSPINRKTRPLILDKNIAETIVSCWTEKQNNDNTSFSRTYVTIIQRSVNIRIMPPSVQH